MKIVWTHKLVQTASESEFNLLFQKLNLQNKSTKDIQILLTAGFDRLKVIPFWGKDINYFHKIVRLRDKKAP